MLKRMGNITDTFGRIAATLTLLLSSSAMVLGSETSTTVPWRNMVNANDTTTMWLLVSLVVLLFILIWITATITSTLVSNGELWKNKISPNAKKVVAIIGFSMLVPTLGMAQDVDKSASPFEMTDSLFWILVVVNAFLAAILILMLYNLSGLISKLRGTTEEVEPSFYDKVEQQLTGSVPMEEERDLLLDHEYDGIRELDNNLPPWWLYLFYFTIIFGVIYFPYYHWGNGELQDEEFKTSMQVAEVEHAARLEKMGNDVDESTVTILTDAADLSEGEKLFLANCQACHLAHGGGSAFSVGPNLTDAYWLHGGSINDIFSTIKYGVPQKGMIAWQTQLSPPKIQKLASFIVSIGGSNPEGAKDAQGELWEEGN